MKFLSVFTVLLVLGVGGVTAQKENPDELVEPAPSKKSAPTKTPIAKGLIFESNSSVQATLLSTIDAKNAKIGDEVVLKTTKSIKQNGEVVIPKGTRLLGRVSEVTKKGKNSRRSKLGIVLDRLEGKRLSTPITASITSITNARAASALDGAGGADIMGSSSTSGRASRGSSGGGLLGGAGSAVGGVLNTTTQVAGTTLGTVGNATGAVGRSVNGLQISQSASGSASGSTVFSAQGKNVRLEKGLKFSLMVTQTAEN